MNRESQPRIVDVIFALPPPALITRQWISKGWSIPNTTHEKQTKITCDFLAKGEIIIKGLGFGESIFRNEHSYLERWRDLRSEAIRLLTWQRFEEMFSSNKEEEVEEVLSDSHCSSSQRSQGSFFFTFSLRKKVFFRVIRPVCQLRSSVENWTFASKSSFRKFGICQRRQYECSHRAIHSSSLHFQINFPIHFLFMERREFRPREERRVVSKFKIPRRELVCATFVDLCNPGRAREKLILDF